MADTSVISLNLYVNLRLSTIINSPILEVKELRLTNDHFIQDSTTKKW